MAAQLGGQPIFILREGTERSKGREAQNNNIMAAKAVANAVRTTLGPKGMDKMLVDGLGDVVITNDGVTILREMDIEHPAAKMVVEVAKTQDDEVGDGTTTAAVLAGELLKVAEDLLDQNVHSTIIASGYRLAADKASEILKTIERTVTEDDEDLLFKISETAMTGKGAESSKDKLSKLVVKAVKSIVEVEGGKKVVDIDNIKVEKKVGGSIEDSELIEGMVIDKERVHPNMPKVVKDAKIAMISEPVEFKKTEVDAEINITSPDQLQLFLDQEEKMLKNMVDKIINSGANVVVCQKGIDDMAQHYMSKAGILAVRRVKKSDMEKLSRASGGVVVTNIDEISESDLGYAGLAEEKKTGGDSMLFITGCKNPKAVSIVIRGGTEHVVDSLERALEDALRVVGVTIEDEKLVAGGGSPEVELSLRLSEYAATLKGREQLAVTQFANALEVIPRTLAENAGLDPIDMMVELKSQHEKGNKNAGLDVYTGDVIDMMEKGVVEPLRVKTQAINSATESAVMILRIDDVIASTGGGEGEMPPEMMGGGMPPGMGGMPPMM
ncbi:MAG: thermosome subunit [ANME-2 cluster archaeon]|nr:thermosome subunit [ANME-2 cluster archaeon]MBC2700735.1 thermosome subunit [ANME-2 cluster archaeon]MBC2709051.1 thermosome subunit [ANME-2 cluster archaeon]MBC2747310.1 thermosome subunit [ANME-2 cluster archaeon]MBC2764082.1 thermosome subunit [ANME-2 cluster archaeon]